MLNKLVKRMENKREERRLAVEQSKYESVFAGKEFELYNAVSNANKVIEKVQNVIEGMNEETPVEKIKSNEELKREFKEQRRLRKLAEEKTKQEKEVKVEIEKEKLLLPLINNTDMENEKKIVENKNKQVKEKLNKNVNKQDEEEIDEIEALVRLAYQMQDEDSIIDDADYLVL